MIHPLLERHLSPWALGMAVAAGSLGLALALHPFQRLASPRPTLALPARPPLELEGRDIFLREGCARCHTPSRVDASASVAAEADTRWQSPSGQRVTPSIGPDLTRGGRSAAWQRAHLRNPRTHVPDSAMPAYPWLQDNRLDASATVHKLEQLRQLGADYDDEDLATAGEAVRGKTEMDALVAYLQGLQRQG